MNVALLALGVVVLVVTIVDVLWTTLWVDGGAGPISRRLANWLWLGLRRLGGRNSTRLGLSGPLALVATLSTWLGLLWVGWTLVFAAGGPAIVSTGAPEPIGWVDAAYYAGYSLFTLGNGGFAPVGGGWQLATDLATASGMLFVTMSVTYVLKVLGAVVDKRAFATGVTGLGGHSEAFVRTGWSGQDFVSLEQPLHEFGSQLDRLAEEHKAYPILHYYHARQPSRSSAVAVAVLDDATTLLGHGVAEETRPSRAALRDAESGVHSYLETLDSAFVDPADRDPPTPDLSELRAAGVPTVDDEDLAEVFADRSTRRRRLLATVEADAWPWPPVDETEGANGAETD